MNSFLPVSEVILTSGLSLFTKVSAMMVGLVGIVFLMRIVGLQARFASMYEYGAVLKDTVLFFVMLSLFPYLVRLIFAVSTKLAHKITYSQMSPMQGRLDDFFTALFSEYRLMKIAAKIGDILVINLAEGIYSIFTALLLSIAPIVLFMSTVLGFEKGLGTYFSTLISISLWPVLWNLIGLFGQELFNANSSSTLTVVVYWLLIQFLQLCSPLFCLFLLKSLSPSGAVTKVMGLGAKL